MTSGIYRLRLLSRPFIASITLSDILEQLELTCWEDCVAPWKYARSRLPTATRSKQPIDLSSPLQSSRRINKCFLNHEATCRDSCGRKWNVSYILCFCNCQRQDDQLEKEMYLVLVERSN
uniref:AlNc14C31G2867 protein n=1 Tax=Albugo laibachii Nc14 TaxID=890382 RepID=F0W7R4_9STRA|nr:AlNc14C31G2867 [Albugo laibachii Nc14]|eukprot:CCA17166.1 AlNc14C31G2867 [Albugo laibachii Nc14]